MKYKQNKGGNVTGSVLSLSFSLLPPHPILSFPSLPTLILNTLTLSLFLLLVSFSLYNVMHIFVCLPM